MPPQSKRPTRGSRSAPSVPRWGSGLISLAVLAALAGGLFYAARVGGPVRAAEPTAGAPAAAPTAAAAGAGGAPGAPAAAPKKDTIRLVIKTVPPKKATVFWGKKRLGIVDRKAPLIVQRPRDSGPLDLVVRAEDCVPVYTRAYTFDDNTLAVRVTPLDQKQTIYGYKAELPPEDAAQDLGAPGAVAPGTENAGGRGGIFSR